MYRLFTVACVSYKKCVYIYLNVRCVLSIFNYIACSLVMIHYAVFYVIPIRK